MKREFTEQEIDALYQNVKDGIFDAIFDEDISIIIAQKAVECLKNDIYDAIDLKDFIKNIVDMYSEEIIVDTIKLFIQKAIQRKVGYPPMADNLQTAENFFDIRANDRKNLCKVLNLRDVATDVQILEKVKEIMNY